ncbi:hypothetical protein HYR99_38630 [Candidatus Poribacteria bacterium]|nr:hypothetical protein [Candidatus Poribacteria bacterium]
MKKRGFIVSIWLFPLVAVQLLATISLLSGCGCEGDEEGESALAIFGGEWEGDFPVSSGQQGLHAYAEISPCPDNGYRSIEILLANIPQGQGWYFSPQSCPENENSVTCILHALPPFAPDGKFYHSGVTETNDGRLTFNPLTASDPDYVIGDGRSKVRYIYKEGLKAGRRMTVEIEAYSQSGQCIKGTLRGTLISVPFLLHF